MKIRIIAITEVKLKGREYVNVSISLEDVMRMSKDQLYSTNQRTGVPKGC